MKIAVARETREGETRVAMVPELVGKLTDLGYEVVVEPGAGDRAEFSDEEYAEAGATVTDDLLPEADVVISVNPLPGYRARLLGDGAATIAGAASPTRTERGGRSDGVACSITRSASCMICCGMR